MTLPLQFWVGGENYTAAHDQLRFRKEAVGGCVSLSARVTLPLGRVDQIKHFDDVTVYADGSGAAVAAGQVADLGRSASSDNARWQVNADGLARHTQDQELPLIYITQSLDSFRQVNRVNRGMTAGVSTKPDNSSDGAPDGLLFHAPEGTTLATSDSVTLRFDEIRDAEMFLGRISFDVDGGSIDTDYNVKLLSSVDGSGGSVHYTFSLSTTASTGNAEVVTTDFANGRNVFDFYLERASGSGKPANDNKWGFVYNLIVRTRLMDETGADVTSGASYGNDYVLAHEVVKDLLGRCLPEYDGTNAYVDTSGTFQIDSFTFPDGTTPAAVFDALMQFERAFRWWVTPAGQFRWEPFTTDVRYLATMEDGGDFPAAGQTLFNEVTTRRRNKRGRVRTATRTAADAGVDDLYLGPKGKVRRAFLDLGDEVGTSSGATRRADNFLADHAYPANAGTLTVARPILDMQTGRMVEPWEIEPGELILVLGIESYPDALNLSSNDGQTVFRIWALDFDGDSNAATLELDTLPRTTYGALVRMMKHQQRRPKR